MPAGSLLTSTEEFYAQLFEYAPDAMVVVAENGRMVMANHQAEALLGYAREELLGRPVEILVPEQSRAMHERLRAEYMENPVVRPMAENRRLSARRKDGSEFCCEISLSPIELNGSRFVSAALRDVTERQRSAEQLERTVAQLEFLKFALDEHADVTVTDAAGVIIYANDRFCRQSKFSREELLGSTHRILKSGRHPDLFYQQMYSTITQGKAWHGEVCNRAKDGGLYWVNCTIVPFTNAQGQIERYVAIRTDISGRKYSEALLREANADLERRNRDLDEFSYIASHDLVEPLRTMLSFSELLPGDLGQSLSANAAKDLDFIRTAARQMKSLVENLLALSRAGKAATQDERISLRECAQRALQTLVGRIADQQAEVIVQDLPEVVADATLMTQLYQNLIGNALKFVHRDRRPVICLTADRCDGEWIYGVRDNGIGIAPGFISQVFTPFKRLHGRGEYEGSGIGLAICRKTVERYGGMIWVESELGEGSHFKFTLRNRSVETYAKSE